MEKFALTPSFIKNGSEIPEKSEETERLSGREEYESSLEDGSFKNSSDDSFSPSDCEKTYVSTEAPDNGLPETEQRGEENGSDERTDDSLSPADNVEAALSFLRAHEARARRILDKNKKPPFSR